MKFIIIVALLIIGGWFLFTYRKDACCSCGKKPSGAGSFKLKDGSCLCARCKKTIPYYLRDCAKNWTKEDYEEYRKYLGYSKEVLYPVVRGSSNIKTYGNLSVDQKSACFYFDNLSPDTLIFDMRYLVDCDFGFEAEKYKEGVFSEKVIGKVKFAFQIACNCFMAGVVEIKNGAKAAATKSFFGNKIRYSHPEEMVEFESEFMALAMIAHEKMEEERYNAYRKQANAQNFVERDELSSALSLFMLDSIDAITVEDLKAQRNRLIKAFHPDADGSIDPKYATKINKAYDLLVSRLA